MKIYFAHPSTKKHIFKIVKKEKIIKKNKHKKIQTNSNKK